MVEHSGTELRSNAMTDILYASREIQIKKKSVFVPFGYRRWVIKLHREDLCIMNQKNEKVLSIDALDAKSKIGFQSTWSHYNTVFRGPSKTVRLLLDDNDLDLLREWIIDPDAFVKRPITGKCELCSMDIGKEYSFYFGKMLDTKVRWLNYMKETTQKFAWEPEPMYVWICDKCLHKRYTKGLYAVGILYVTLILFLLIVLLVAGLKGIHLILFMTVFCVLWAGCFGFIVLFVRTRTSNKDIGDKMAIRLRKADLKERGYDLFWTSREKPQGGVPIPRTEVFPKQ